MSSVKNVTLSFRDGKATSVAVQQGESVLDAALAAGIPVIHQCRSGSCSSCMAKLVEGRAGMRAGASSTLLRSEYEAGDRLLCLTEPETNCTFTLNYASDAADVQAVKAHAFVDSVEKVASNVVRLRLELAEGAWLDFKPGQFIQVRVPGTNVTRSYSPASTAADLPKLELLIRVLEDGVMSKWLEQEAKPDDVLEIEGPFGSFFLREKVPAPHIMVAGGTGLAPILSMIDALRRQPGRKPPILLSFGCATPEQLFCLDDLELRRQWLPNLKTRISVDHHASGELLAGNPVDAIGEADVTHESAVAYLCGPPRMIEAATTKLVNLGLRPENIYAEQFAPSN
ncbi:MULTISPECIES: ring-hydroxylating dioxygenase ferredoxin reductase family protein [unclassified Paraburkholderia]|uniref:ring-hydroxylating dioxygenase ferredoxin reductase family protein n=1 Tax=unclassified Paraburkholderia TaxID=2615204 RepID=UPI00161591C1|nr:MULTISPECIES: ring-hydroxylating dioxygenase ferredoxin reductase family protein [unclassified Paraburkholderia]MBC8727532.1 ring-hydroxylating dioxygenase ferredoxin reductase family protein [Paraburkholderia sp. UCT2]